MSTQVGGRQWGHWWGVALASKVRRRYDRPERAGRARLLGTHFDGHFLQILVESHAGAGCEFYIDRAAGGAVARCRGDLSGTSAASGASELGRPPTQVR